jgi:hypothetical protein
MEDRGPHALCMGEPRSGQAGNFMTTQQPHPLEEDRAELPALVFPEGPGYMPLFTDQTSVPSQPR